MLPGLHVILIAQALVAGGEPAQDGPSLRGVEVLGPAHEGRRRGTAPFTVRGSVELPPDALSGPITARVRTVAGVEGFPLEAHGDSPIGAIDFTFRLPALPLALEIETATGTVKRGLAAEIAPPPDGARLANLAARLAAPEMEGRLTGSDGQQRATDVVIEALGQAGVRPSRFPGSAGEGHTLPFPIVIREPTPDSALEVADHPAAGTAVPVAPFIFSPPTGEGAGLSRPVIFAGYGLSRPGADDYLDADLRGALAVVRAGVPPLLARQEAAPLLRERIEAAQAHKAGALLILDETLSLAKGASGSDAAGGDPPPASPLTAWLSYPSPVAALASPHERLRADLAQAAHDARVTIPVRGAPEIPVLAGGIEAVETILATRSLDAAMADLRERHPPGAVMLPVSARLRLGFLWRTISGRNVAGEIRKTAFGKERPVAIVTCSDGRGLDAEGHPLPGQDLSAWLSAAVIEAARGAASRQEWLARPLVVGLLDGGEWGGLGARALASSLAQEKSQPPLQTIIVFEARPHATAAEATGDGSPALVASGAEALVARAAALAADLGLEMAPARGGETSSSAEALGERAASRLYVRFHIAPDDTRAILAAARLITALAVSEAATP